ncbi:MAG TPA: adenylyltransferase/cytidyltransferase family protein [Patescibacteria group bacterium]|nr:adenylyltransferase/cytidyltransferase family protein [Patescibacteria group bacterium]
MKQNQKTVLVFGVFDLFHKGHEYFLQQAKRHGDKLVVIVARDINVQKNKFTKPHDDEQARMKQVQQCGAVNEVRLGYEDWSNRWKVLKDIRPDVICMGYDQQFTLPRGSWTTYRIDAFLPKKYKTTQIKKGVRLISTHERLT